MRILFAGTPYIAVKSLEKIVGEGFNIAGVLTAPDRPKGRGKRMIFSPVKEVALRYSLSVLQPDKLDENAIAKVRDLNPDILVVVAYGKIFRENFLSIFPVDAINLHPSLLPKFRGPSPIPACILSGEKETGVTIQKIAKKVDSGDIIKQTQIRLTGRETTTSLTELLSEVGANLLVEVLRMYESGEKIEYTPQREEEATYCRLIKKEDGLIDWNRNAVIVDRMVRAYNPWPRAYTSLDGNVLIIREGFNYSKEIDEKGAVNGEVIGIDRRNGILVKTGDGVYCITELQMQYKKPMDWRAFVNGYRDLKGTVLGG